MIGVRAETPGDRAAIRGVVEAAFGRPDEAALVDALRDAGSPHVSLVAEEGGTVLGHVLFSPVTLESCEDLLAFGLAPLSVLPEHQRLGIGSRLVVEGMQECRRSGIGAVFVLGDPAYYRRFGFAPAVGWGLRCEFAAPDEAFMAAELRRGALDGARGLVRYRPEFGAFQPP